MEDNKKYIYKFVIKINRDTIELDMCHKQEIHNKVLENIILEVGHTCQMFIDNAKSIRACNYESEPEKIRRLMGAFIMTRLEEKYDFTRNVEESQFFIESKEILKF